MSKHARTEAEVAKEEPDARVVAGVARLLLETRVLQLERDVKRKKLELFWNIYNMHRLNTAVRIANERHARCVCNICLYYHRDPSASSETTHLNLKKCLFAEWLVAQYAAFGLQTLRFRDNICVKCCFAGNRPHRPVDPARDCVMHMDCHLVTSGPCDGYIRYGRRLYGATSVQDPELRKLRRFIAHLEGPSFPREPIEAEMWDVDDDHA